MSQPFEIADQPARDRIATALDETLFVEAGAGTGKTTSLVRRLLAMVTSGRATLDSVAVITFTEAAAAELRDRVREVLEKTATEESRPGVERERCVRALRDLDQAAVQTLHAFAGRLLRERPTEAGLPPSFETLDEIQAGLLLKEEWSRWMDTALDRPGLADALRLAVALGFPMAKLEEVSTAFHDNHDLLAKHPFPAAPAVTVDGIRALADAASEIRRLSDFSRLGADDPLFVHTRMVAGRAESLAQFDPTSPRSWRSVLAVGKLTFTRGKASDWDADPVTRINACARLKAMLKELQDGVDGDLSMARQAALLPLLEDLRVATLEAAKERKRRGVATFHDLLVWARDLVRDNVETRDHFRGRFTHLFIDEFQDTDPVQAEIAMFLAEDAPAYRAGRTTDWTAVHPKRGKLFVVGDPKQSIYRFRRADILTVQRFQAVMGEAPVTLSQSFRSHRPVIEWVNHVFTQWMTAAEGQAAYSTLSHRWEPRADGAVQPAVWWTGDAESKNVDETREREAEAVAAVLRRVHAEGWPILDVSATERDGEQRYRAAGYGQMCVLIPRRTSLSSLETALEDAGVPFRLEGASLVLATQEVRDLLNCLRAVDDPVDQVALVAALRSPAFACSDVDLLEWVERGGRLDYLSPNAEGGPVAAALAALRHYHERRVWTTPARLIDELVRDRRLAELALDAPRPRERWRRYQFLSERARAFAETGDPTLRGFLDWMETQAEEGARIQESPVPEADEDAVRVMTVHASKGLEFPVVVLMGINGVGKAPDGPVLVDHASGRLEVKLEAFQTPGWEALREREKVMEEREGVRLMYVAATRARDHLIVSVFRKSGDQSSPAGKIAGFLNGHDDIWRGVDASPAALAQVPAHSEPPLSNDTLQAREAWTAARAGLILARSRPSGVAATRLARVDKEPLDEGGGVPSRRGRAGTGIGRAVHAVLQSVDLATGAGLDAIARAEAIAEGVPWRAGEVARLTRVALASDTVRRAVVSGRFWREVWTGAPVGAGVVEGFIDLLFEEADGLVVVDYKTDAVEGEAEMALAVERYRLQAGAYALAVSRAAERRVTDAVLLFLHQGEEVHLTDVDALAEEAERATLRLLRST